MPKNWERVLFYLVVSLILVILAWLVLDLGRSAMGQALPLPTMASTSWVAPQATSTPILQPWTPSPVPATVTPSPNAYSVYLPLIGG